MAKKPSKKLSDMTLLEKLTEQANRLPRFTRIILTMTISLVFAAAIWLPFSGLSSNLWIVIIIAWFAAYIGGWWALVGFEDDTEEWQANNTAVGYLIFGAISLFLLTLEVLFFLMVGFVF